MAARSPGWTAVARSLAFVSLCSCASAFAEATYELSLNGTIVHSPDCWENLPACEFGPPPDVIWAWTGHVTLDVDSSGDGTFSDPDLMSFALDANLGGFSVPNDPAPPPPFRLYPFYGTVTIADGKVASIDASYFFESLPDISVHFSGLSVGYTQPPLHHYGPTTAVGSLTMVPEPATWRLLLGGLLLSAAMGTRRNGWRRQAGR